MLAVAISFRIAYPLAVTKCQVNVLLLTLNINTDLRSRLSSPSFQALKLLSCQSCVIVLSRQNTILEREHLPAYEQPCTSCTGACWLYAWREGPTPAG